MSKSLTEVTQAAVKLPASERLQLARILLDLSEAHAEPDAGVESAWDKEIERRLGELRSGKVRGVPLEEVKEEDRKALSVVRIELHPEAEAEFAAEIEYYEAQQTGLGQRFYGTVMKCLDWIVENPGVPTLRKNYRRVNLRAFRFYIAYAVEGDLIRVLAVAHGARKPEYWKSRMKSR